MDAARSTLSRAAVSGAAGAASSPTHPLGPQLTFGGVASHGVPEFQETGGGPGAGVGGLDGAGNGGYGFGLGLGLGGDKRGNQAGRCNDDAAMITISNRIQGAGRISKAEYKQLYKSTFGHPISDAEVDLLFEVRRLLSSQGRG
jgi:hypothetical protein